MTAKYINIFTDFGFKKIFGEEADKALLIDFLNALLMPVSLIKNLTFKNTEHLGRSTFDRKAIFDLYCENAAGEKFIVELQKAKQNFFKERTVFYSAFPIVEQGEKGEWDYNLNAVYCIGLLDFAFNEKGDNTDKNKLVHVIKLRDSEGKVFYDKLTYIYIEMPKFNKTEAELYTRLDKWLYFIKNLEDFQSIPDIFKHEAVFTAAFEKAAVANFNKAEYESYEYSLKNFRDWYSILKTAEKDNTLKIAKLMKANGASMELIIASTGLSKEETDAL